jgi:transcriptional regulator with XRE-family HTH domain
VEISASCDILKVKENMLLGGSIMAKKITYPNIDMQQTGRRLKYLIESAGYTPRRIQEHLHLSCVQPIYRWYKGKILPSVDHLLMLSELLNVHMEDFLVKKDALPIIYDIERYNVKAMQRRILLYCNKMYQSVA